jgi:hypothetical protein
MRIKKKKITMMGKKKKVMELVKINQMKMK